MNLPCFLHRHFIGVCIEGTQAPGGTLGNQDVHNFSYSWVIIVQSGLQEHFLHSRSDTFTAGIKDVI